MTDDLRTVSQSRAGGLQKLDLSAAYQPCMPVKRINDGDDLSFFLTSTAYTDIMTFLLQLNQSMFPRSHDGVVTAWPSDSYVSLSSSVMRIRVLVQTLRSMLKEAPPHTGPRRFGNIAFKKWYELVENRIPELLDQAVPESVWEYTSSQQARKDLKQELGAYILGSFGSPQRLDYGTGHELSFLAFLGCIWKLNGFAQAAPGAEERGIVVGIVQPYAVRLLDDDQQWRLTASQISRTRPHAYHILYPRTSRFSRCLGPRRPLLSPIHIRICSVLAAYYPGVASADGGFAPRGTSA